jgi:hypothetical protein
MTLKQVSELQTWHSHVSVNNVHHTFGTFNVISLWRTGSSANNSSLWILTLQKYEYIVM